MTLPRDVRGTELHAAAVALVPAPGLLVDLSDVASCPDGSRVAVTASVRGEPPHVRVLDAGSGEELLRLPDGSRRPAWSADGALLATLQPAGPGRELPVVGGATCPPVGGTVEQLAWAPDGPRLLLLVAEAGAELSDVYGSGRVPDAGDLAAWLPEVGADDGAGRRRLVVWEPLTGDLTEVPLARNVWEASWAGPQAVCAITSPRPHEDDWYDAQLTHVTLDGSVRLLPVGDAQVALPRACPSGEVLSVLAGRASDRDLLAGVLHLVDPATGAARPVDTDVHVTSHAWRDDDVLVLAGLRGTDSVVAEVDRAGVVTEVWSTTEAIGPADLLPAVVVAGAGVALVRESAVRAPEVCVVEGGRVRTLLQTELPAGGRPERLSWTSSDGLRVDGLLHLPAGPARALVVAVHGGPVWCWRDTWPGRVPHLPLLLSRGFAVLLPNPRGSCGRGEAYSAGIVGEIGGRDADDVLAGADAVAARGLVPAGRVAALGTSYGGFLAAWLAATGRVAAAVAVSPATDWVSQHFTTNIPASDVRFLTGSPLDVTSQYVTRSPVRAVGPHSAPTLLTAGLLDLATPAGQAVELAHALREQGVAAELALYPLEGHDVHGPEASLDHATRVLLWLEQHLP